MNCKICNKKIKSFNGLGTHISRIHKISTKEYYNKFLKKENEGICECGKETNFNNINIGYREFCSIKCATSSKKWKENRKETWLRKHGVEHPCQSKEYKEKRIKNNQSAKINNKPLFNFFAPMINWSEDVRRDKNDRRILNILCKKCKKKWFIPKMSDLNNRVQVLNGNRGNSESNLYCSDDCKQTCSIFHKSNYQSDHPIHDENNRPYYNEWRKAVFENANYECERCGSLENIVSHHIKPVKTHPNLCADIDNGICLCSICDKKAHQIDGCKTGQLARMICL